MLTLKATDKLLKIKRGKTRRRRPKPVLPKQGNRSGDLMLKVLEKETQPGTKTALERLTKLTKLTMLTRSGKWGTNVPFKTSVKTDPDVLKSCLNPSLLKINDGFENDLLDRGLQKNKK